MIKYNVLVASLVMMSLFEGGFAASPFSNLTQCEADEKLSQYLRELDDKRQEDASFFCDLEDQNYLLKSENCSLKQQLLALQGIGGVTAANNMTPVMAASILGGAALNSAPSSSSSGDNTGDGENISDLQGGIAKHLVKVYKRDAANSTVKREIPLLRPLAGSRLGLNVEEDAKAIREPEADRLQSGFAAARPQQQNSVVPPAAASSSVLQQQKVPQHPAAQQPVVVYDTWKAAKAAGLSNAQFHLQKKKDK
jgi:hypothetical protein